MTIERGDVGAARRELEGLTSARDDAGIVCAHARAVWSVLAEPGDRVAGALVQTHGAAAALDLATATHRGGPQAEAAGLTVDELAAGRRRWEPRLVDAPRALANARRAGVRLLTPEDAAWPHRLDDLGPFAPLCLWVRGDPGVLARSAAGVAIVGARAASTYGEHVAGEFAVEAAGSGVAVYSGAAYGIDGAAHRAALAAGGATIAVMAGGVERPYPAGHRDLIDRIARSGAVIAEVACGTAPTKHRFLARNRVIAALSDATVVVEAGWRSGALNTAHHAQALGRPVGVVPGPITSATSMGCHRLLREGDAVCVTGFDDVRELWGGVVSAASQPAAGPDPGEYTGDRTRILDALSGRAPRSVEDIARRAGFSVEEASALLGLLDLEGHAARRPTGWVRAPGPGMLEE